MGEKIKKFKSILYSCLIFVIYLVLQRAQLSPYVSPFALAFLFALGYNYNSYLFNALAYSITFLITKFSALNLIVLLNVLLCFALLFFLTKKFGERVPKVVIFLLVLFSCVGNICVNAMDSASLVQLIVSAFLSVAFCYTDMCFLKVLKLKGTSAELMLDEAVGLALFVMSLSLGLYEIYVFNISVLGVLVVFFVLLFGNIKSNSYVMAFAICVGIGVAFGTGSIVSLAVYACYAIIEVLTNKTIKYFSASLIIFVDCLLGVYFNAYAIYNVFNFLAPFIGSVAFLCIPQRVINRLSQTLNVINYDSIVFEEQKLQMSKRLNNLADLLFLIDDCYKQMLVGEFSAEEVKIALRKELFLKVCKNCPNSVNCYSEKRNMTDCLETAIWIALKKGNIRFVDIPEQMTSCENYNSIISIINQLVEQYKRYTKKISAENKSKVMVGNQLMSAGKTIKEMLVNFDKKTRAEYKEEQAFLQELLYNHISAKECVIINSGDFVETAIVVVPLGVNKDDFLLASEKFFKTKLGIEYAKYSKFKGMQEVKLRRSPKFGFVFGSSSVSKNNNEFNGDCFSFVDLGDGKFLFSISDGKGSGKNAQNISERTMRLIEFYYKAGIEAGLMINSLNQIMSFNNTENFSAVDICLADTNSGKLDFIKLGSTPSVIKRSEKIEAIVSESLPVGVCEFAKINIKKDCLVIGDIVVLSSDGVFDSFGDLNDYMGFINNLRIVNMDLFAKSILEEAICRSGGKAVDDMTVIAFRWLGNY